MRTCGFHSGPWLGLEGRWGGAGALHELRALEGGGCVGSASSLLVVRRSAERRSRRSGLPDRFPYESIFRTDWIRTLLSHCASVADRDIVLNEQTLKR
jgi:hypothetical protein